MDENLRNKVVGYTLRIAAILIWATAPLVVKYFLIENLTVLEIVALNRDIALLCLLPLVLFQMIFKKRFSSKKGYTKAFWIFIVFDSLFMITYFLSVEFTYATNAVLFLSFAPVVAIIAAIVFWRKEVVYLQEKRTLKKVVIIFFLGSIGTSILILSKGSVANYQVKLFGDSLAFLAMLFDVVATTALIFYTKSKNAFSGLYFVFNKSLILAVILSPVTLELLINHCFSMKEFLGLLYLGIFGSALAYFFAYEAFKRLDGFINYLLLNLIPIVVLAIEVIFFDMPLNFIFVIGIILILGSAISAEYINTKCEQKQRKSVE
jgi:drug/metabolite transporter (DMT)-like permease